MRQYSDEMVLEAAFDFSANGAGKSGQSRSRTDAVNRISRFYLVLTAFFTTSMMSATAASANAASHHGINNAHAGVAVATSKPIPSIRPARDKRIHWHSRMASNAAHHSARARNVSADRHVAPIRLASAKRRHGDTRNAKAMHRDAVPLANTTWDNPEVPPAVLDAIQSAARESGVDPHLLAAIAWRESRFDPNARSQQSSAKGLLQFTTGTWLQMVRDYGSQHDVADYAAAIHTTQSGDLIVSDQMRDAILKLRDDPILSAKLAAENMMRQRTVIQAQLKRRLRPADFYLIHVLGPTGAARFLTAVAKHPTASSLDVASLTVMRNAGLLARDGKALTVANTYVATQRMLNAQHTHSAPMLSAAKATDNTTSATPIQVSEAP